MLILYPSIGENWTFFQKNPSFLDSIKTYSEIQFIRHTADWLPFVFILTCLFINTILHIQFLMHHNRVLNTQFVQSRLDVFEKFSENFFKKAAYLIGTIVFGSIYVFLLFPKVNLAIPEYQQSKTSSPNIFMFVIDSLRYDRLVEHNYQNVMPFLRSQISSAEIFEPMLASHNTTMQSWGDITSGKMNVIKGTYSTKNTVPHKSSLEDPMFLYFYEHGYKTVFVSDFLSTKNISEKKIISLFPALLSVLILPKWQSFSLNFFEIPIPADPRLLGNGFSNVLKSNQKQKPLFVTTFFSLDTIESDEFKSPYLNTIYDASLNSIDKTLQILISELKQKEWLKNSVVLIFGTHGKSFESVNNELQIGNDLDFLTPFFLISDTEKYALFNDALVRTIDIFPTLVQKVFPNADNSFLEGVSILRTKSQKLNNYQNRSYRESQRFFLKERAWIDEKYKLIISSTHDCTTLFLFDRNDYFSRNNLLLDTKNKGLYENIMLRMRNELNHFLTSRDVEIIHNQESSFFYSESFNYE